MAKEGHRKRQFDHGANMSISYNTCIWSTGDQLGVIPSKRSNGTVRVRCNVEEVDVLAMVVEVVVHDDGSGSSGSCFVDVRGHGEEFDVHGVFEGRW